MLKYTLRKTIFLIPPTMLFVSALSSFVDMNIYLLGDILGYSLLTDLVFVYVFFFTRNYCAFTRFSVIGLLIMNLVSILSSLIPYFIYSYIYDVIIVGIVSFLGIIYTIRDR